MHCCCLVYIYVISNSFATSWAMAKWLSEEALQIVRKEKKLKAKVHTHLNAEFQRTARRDKKAFLSGQCKEIEENNRMGKTIQENQRYQGNISCKDGLDKGQKW